MDKLALKKLLDDEVAKRNSDYELSFNRPDPLLILHKYPNELVALVSALFAYGRASLIVKFLDSLDFQKIFSCSIDKKILKNILKDISFEIIDTQEGQNV